MFPKWPYDDRNITILLDVGECELNVPNSVIG